jgi:hypothetical protein
MESTTIPPVRRNRRNAEQWSGLLDRFEQSGQTLEQFCAEHDLGLSTFGRWRKRLRRQVVPAPKSATDALFVELSRDVSASQLWDVELQLGGGMCLRVRRTGC